MFLGMDARHALRLVGTAPSACGACAAVSVCTLPLGTAVVRSRLAEWMRGDERCRRTMQRL